MCNAVEPLRTVLIRSGAETDSGVKGENFPICSLGPISPQKKFNLGHVTNMWDIGLFQKTLSMVFLAIFDVDVCRPAIIIIFSKKKKNEVSDLSQEKSNWFRNECYNQRIALRDVFFFKFERSKRSASKTLAEKFPCTRAWMPFNERRIRKWLLLFLSDNFNEERAPRSGRPVTEKANEIFRRARPGNLPRQVAREVPKALTMKKMTLGDHLKRTGYSEKCLGTAREKEGFVQGLDGYEGKRPLRATAAWSNDKFRSLSCTKWSVRTWQYRNWPKERASHFLDRPEHFAQTRPAIVNPFPVHGPGREPSDCHLFRLTNYLKSINWPTDE